MEIRNGAKTCFSLRVLPPFPSDIQERPKSPEKPVTIRVMGSIFAQLSGKMRKQSRATNRRHLVEFNGPLRLFIPIFSRCDARFNKNPVAMRVIPSIG